MMRTEDDIRRALDLEPDRDALARLTGFAGELAELPAAPTVELHRRRVLPLLAAAAAVVLVAGGGVTIVQLRDGGSGPAGGEHLSASERRPVWNLRVAKLAGYTVTRISASSIGLEAGSTSVIASTDPKRPEQGVMSTCPRSLHYCSEPVHPRRGRITVDGRPGYFFAGHPLKPGEAHGHPWQAARADDGHQPDVTWYAGHRTTVFLQGTFGFDPKSYTYDNAAAKKILLRIASAVSAGHRDATHLPFELHGLPGRVAPESVRTEHGDACSEYGTGPRSVNDPLGVVFTACRVRTGSTRSATIAAAVRADSNAIDGSTRFLPEHPVVHDYADGTSLVIAVEPDRRAIVSQDLARRLAGHADVSPRLGDTSTWLVVG